MKRLVTFCIFAAALNAAAALTVTATNGVESLTLAFDAAADARELWVAWDDADKGAGFADWAESERVAIVAADETALTVALPNDARRAAYARFFLFAGGASYPCAFIRGTGTQCIDTGFTPTPQTAISIDAQLENPGKVTQLLFSAYGSFFVAAYSNGSGAWAWAFRDDSGNWASTHISASSRRTSVTLDGPGDRYSLAVEGTEIYATNISAIVALDKRTKTSAVTLALLAKHENSAFSSFAEARLYGATIDEAGVRQHTYAPYVSAGVAGVYDSVTDAFLGNAGTGAFTPCGRGGDVSGAEAGEALDLDAVRGGPAEPETVFVNVASGEVVTFDGPSTIDYRLVKVGGGTLVLEGTRTFNEDVIVSNGILRANWATCGLADTHVGLCNSNSTGSICYFQETSSSFTATPGLSGPGTIELRYYAGIVPYQQDLTVNLGGDGRTVKRNANGFNVTALMLTHASSSCNSTFVNNIDLAGNNFETKGSSSTGTAFYTGYITNSTSKTAGIWNFYTGKAVLVGTRGTANPRVDFYGYRIANHSTALVFSNAIIRMTSDFISGTASNDTANTTLVNCDRSTTGGWTYSGGKPEATLTIDGGIYNGTSNFRVGTTGNRSGTLVITNDVSMFFPGVLSMYTNATYRQYGGNVTLGKFEMMDGYAEMNGGTLTLTNTIGLNVGMTPNGKLVRFLMKGGSIYVNDSKSLLVGGYGHGWFHQTGGEVSAGYYPSIGRYAGGEGRLDVHGGTFTHRNQNYIRIGEVGTGVVSVANGGTFTDLADYSPMTYNAAGKGTLILSPDGTFETPALNATGAGRDSSVVFNGGTMKLRTNGYPSDFLNSNISRVTVSPYGGAIDTNGKGDFTLSRALGPSTDAGDLCEALAHRWSFKEGSLVDSVGGLVAVTNGAVDLEDGAVRLKGLARGQSCINLGTTLLPNDGRGATIELWVTPITYKSWSRVIAFGSGNGTVKDIYLSFNNGKSTDDARSHFRIYGSGTDEYAKNIAMPPGRTYHVAVVLDPQLDGRFLNTAYISDAATGELLEAIQEASNVGWTPAEVAQENGCWLGHSNSSSNPDPDARYHEVRIHHRPMSAAQVQASCLAGPDAVYYFRKKGAGTLTMTGANTYTVGTAVDAGTLKLASGATLPATEMWAGADATLDLNGTAQTAKELGGTGTVKGGTLAVTDTIQPGGRKAVGTLTVDGTSLTSGTLVVDLDANGASDCLAVTGTLDLSNLSLALSDATALDETKIYTIATAPSFTGTFASVTLPNRKWRVSVADTKVKLVYANGTVLFFR